MTTEAQINANRANAQKSTGPRTPEGKAVVAQNAVQHGLLAQDVVIQGEDPGQFELYRDGMLAELAPAGVMESMLAERIVSLSWRLRRAERLQVAAFEKVEEKSEPLPVMSPEDAEWLLERIAERGIRVQPPVEEGPAFGRRAAQDFNQERVLDRLLMYERRIEHSLYRTMAELRAQKLLHVQSPLQAGAIGTGTTPRSTGILPVNPDHGRDAHATETSGGVAASVPEAREQSCETKPIGEGLGVQGSGISSLKPDPRPLTPELPCETKPISARRIKDGEGYRPIFRRRR